MKKEPESGFLIKETKILGKKITDITLQTELKVRVVYKSDLFNWSEDKKHKDEGCFFLVELMDENCSGVRGVSFGDTAKRLHPQIELGKIYIVSGVTVSNKPSKYVTLFQTPQQLSFTPQTNFKPTYDLTFPHMNYEFSNLHDILLKPNNSIVNFFCIIIHVSPLSTITALTTGNLIPKRNLNVMDDSNEKVQLHLWYKDAESVVYEVGQLLKITGAFVSVWNEKKVSIPNMHLTLSNWTPPTKEPWTYDSGGSNNRNHQPS